LLKYVVNEHKNCCEMVKRMSDNTSLIFFVFYCFSIPIADLMCILLLDENIETLYRILYFIFFVACIIFISLINYSLSMIPREAHRPYNKLNSIMARNSAPTILKWKLLVLIEKLSGPKIGFYCLNIFSFTNFEYYLYISYCLQNFILLISLFGKK